MQIPLSCVLLVQLPGKGLWKQNGANFGRNTDICTRVRKGYFKGGWEGI